MLYILLKTIQVNEINNIIFLIILIIICFIIIIIIIFQKCIFFKLYLDIYKSIEY